MNVFDDCVDLLGHASNPYLAEFNETCDVWGSFTRRSVLAQRYAWAVPCDAALDALARHAPLVEIGAGTGYWAWLLRQRGVDIEAFDLYPPDLEPNTFHQGQRTWTEVKRGSFRVLKRFPDRTLFLCWPPYDQPLARRCLEKFLGSTLVYVGEGRGGCTADHAFFDRLDAEWSEVGYVKIPQWFGINDYMSVWERKL